MDYKSSRHWIAKTEAKKPPIFEIRAVDGVSAIGLRPLPGLGCLKTNARVPELMERTVNGVPLEPPPHLFLVTSITETIVFIQFDYYQFPDNSHSTRWPIPIQYRTRLLGSLSYV